MNPAAWLSAFGADPGPRRGVAWLGGLFIAAIVGFALYDSVRGYHLAVANIGRDLDAQARVIAEQTARSVQAVDVVLRHLAEQQRDGAFARLDAQALHAVLREQAVGLVQADGLAMHDAQGNALALSWIFPTPLPAANATDRVAFKAVRDDPHGDVYIGDAVRSRVDGATFFPIVRRLITPAGEFAGTVAARGRIDYFQQFYRDAQPDPSTKVTLMHRGGTLLARYPPVEAALGKHYPLLDEMLAAAASGASPTRTVSPVDGVERFGAVRLVPDYPLAVIVTRDTTAALGPWHAQAVGSLWRTLALAALAALLLAVLLRQLARLNAAHGSLAESQERYALAMTGSNEGHWLWNIPQQQIYVSAKLAELFGIPGGAQLMADSAYFECIPLHPEDRATVHRNRNDHVAGLTPRLDHEFRIVVPGSGEVRWIHTRAQCFRAADGRPLRMAGSTVDATDRKRTEQARRESEERFALAVAGSDDGIWDWNYATGQAFASQRGREILGLPPGPELQSIVDWFAQIEQQLHPDDRPLRHAAIEAHLAGTTPTYEGEYRVRSPDRRYRWIRARGMCVRDADGRPLRMAGSVSDVDARRRAEDALRVSEERYALAMTGSTGGHWVWEVATDALFVSGTVNQLFGLPEDTQPVSRTDYFLHVALHPDDRPMIARIDEEVLAGRSPRVDFEYRIVLPEGSEPRWILTRAQSFCDAQGRIVRVAGVSVDISARKRTEQALRESEERFALAVAGSDDGIWDWNYANGQAFASQRAREILGLPPGPELQSIEAWFTRMESLIHPEDLPRRNAALEDHLAGRTPAYEGEWRVVRPDGGHRWVRVHGMCVRDASGQPLRIAGSVSDIDARKRAEAALRESEERLALSMAGSNDGLLDWDIVADRMFTSRRAMRIAGVQVDTLVRTRAEWSALLQIHPDDVQRHAEDFKRHLEGGTEVREGDYRVRHPDGRYRWVRVRGMSVRDSEGRAVRWAGSVSDIDVQKRTEEALRRSEERYQLAVDGSNEGLWDWDLASDMLFLSPRAQELVWLAPGEPLRPRRYWIERTVYHPDDVRVVQKAISDHLRGRTPLFTVEYRLRHHSGVWHWYRQRGVAVRDARGRPTRMAGSMENISARKNAEAERDRLELQLRQAQKLEAIGTLAGGIAHDFNNILSAILGYGELAQKDAADGTPLRRHIDAALSAGLRAKSLVERILAFSRAGMGERVPVHVQSVVAEALDGVSASLPAGVRLVPRLEAGDAGVLGDPTQIHQVVLNLCANAVQAMKAEGRLSVEVDVVEFGEPRLVTTRTLAPGHYVRLAVGDTGSGIAPHVLERIFDPFFTTKEIGVGTGLGLSLVHGIVTDLGGGIAIDSRPSEGAVFTVWLPWQSYVAAPAVAEEHIAPGAGETILLVDDEEALVRLGEEMLAELGYEPVGFASSTAALETFRADPDRFHAVLSDEAMPELTGSELVAQIRRIRPEIPIVLMSGYVSAALTARAREAGVAEVLGKPLVSRDIARSLANALRPGTM